MPLRIRAALYFSILIVLAACQILRVSPPMSTQNPPLYPGATDVRNEDVTKTQAVPQRHISFQVDAAQQSTAR